MKFGEGGGGRGGRKILSSESNEVIICTISIRYRNTFSELTKCGYAV